MLLTRKDPPASDSSSDASTPTPSSSGSLFKGSTATPTKGPSAPPAATPKTEPSAVAAHSRKLIVGQGISLSGEINACDRLVVEGTVKVVLNRTVAIEITETGVFTDGKAEVEDAEISGVYEGELTVRGRLLIRATGRVSGTVHYRELEIEKGGKLSGSLSLLDKPS
jgi:cytoskeletal protein CcmA (bactofilin family)